MEINGVANIKVLLVGADLDPELRKKIEEQLDLLQRYMKACDQVVEKNGCKKKLPAWHEIRLNKDKYPK